MDDDTGAFDKELRDIMISLQKAFNTSTVTEFHFCVFDKLLHHLEGAASGIARAGGVSSETSPPPSLTLTQGTSYDVNFLSLDFVIAGSRFHMESTPYGNPS
jgi:hypothetical protein